LPIYLFFFTAEVRAAAYRVVAHHPGWRSGADSSGDAARLDEHFSVRMLATNVVQPKLSKLITA